MQWSFERILVAVDGSPQSNVGLEMAVFLAKRLGSKTTVMHVVSREKVLPDAHFLPREGDTYTPVNQATIQMSRFVKLPAPRENVLPENVVKEVTAWLFGRGRSVVDSASSTFKAEGIAVEERLVEAADPAEKILEESESGKYSLIVVGNSGDEGGADSHLGSIAKAIAVGSKTSVLIVRQKSYVESILVPVDGSPKAEEVIRYAFLLAAKLEAKVELLHVQESSILSFRPNLKEVGEKILEDAAKIVKDVEVTQSLKVGDPAKVIIQTAVEGKHDLIVMGRGRRGILRAVMLGSVSDHVVHHATVPVLVMN